MITRMISRVTTAAAPPATPKRIAIKLTTDINQYSPLMSSAFSIHIAARDDNGNPIKGKWTITWGQFCTAQQDAGGGYRSVL